MDVQVSLSLFSKMIALRQFAALVWLLSAVSMTLGKLSWGKTKFLFVFGDSYTTTGELYRALPFLWLQDLTLRHHQASIFPQELTRQFPDG